MRIALVSQEYPPETAKGGLGTQTHFKAHGLAAMGHEIHVVSRSPGGERSERWDGSVHLIRIPGWETRMPLHTELADWLTYSAEVASTLESLHKRQPLDLVEFPEWGAEGFVFLLNRTSWNPVRTIIQLHGPLVMLAHTVGWPDPGSEFYRAGTAMEASCLRLADAVYSSSHCSAAWCGRHYGLNAEEIPVLHTGIDTAAFAPRHGARAARPTVIFVGRLGRHKGVPLLVEAACRLAREFPDLQLRLLGRGEEGFLREISARTEREGLEPLLDLPGYIPRDQLPEHLARAHVFAAPSQYEGGPGFVYLEAMSCGLPVVACSNSGVTEVVQHESNGLLVPPEDVEALTAALRSLLADAAYRQRLGDAAREFVLARADSRVCIPRLETLYRSVVEGGPRRGAGP